jgi:HlyD family secretion protein
MKRRTRNLILLLLVLAALAPILWWWLDFEGQAPTRNYLTTTLTRGDLRLTVSSTGTLAAVETVAVGTEVSGTVARVLVDYNDQVHQGQVLAELKPALFNAAVSNAQGAVDQASASLELARIELERNQPLFDQGYLSAQEFLPYSINFQRAQAGLASARAGLVQAQTNLANSIIRSPISGTVIQRSIDAGQTVAASLNTPTLFVIARDLARMQIEAAVDETDIGQIRQGQPVNFSVQSWPDRGFTGVVRQVRLQPETVQNVVTYTVIVAAENSEGLLLPGMTATVDFVVDQVENQLLVPNAALRFRPAAAPATATRPPVSTANAAQVYVLDGQGRLQKIKVTAGLSDGQNTQVSGEGLHEGLAVVTGENVAENGQKSSFSLFGAMRGRPRK